MQVTFIAAPIALLVVVAVIVGLVMLVRALPPGSGPKVALGVGGLLALAMLFFGYSRPVMVERQAAVPQNLRSAVGSGWHDDPSDQFQVKPPRVEVRAENLVASVSEPTKPTPSKEKDSTIAEKPNEKPAWLSQGTQTGNGVSQFPVSSELFSTVSECYKDLDSRMPGLIAEEVRFLRGEPESIALVPGEAQRLVAETYTEEFPITSNGTWYKVHRLIKIDEPTWAVFRMRFQQAQLEGRMLQLGLGLGGLMLILGVVYLFLRRPPRVVDPTLNTFSTT